jgi:hypothetical protein
MMCPVASGGVLRPADGNARCVGDPIRLAEQLRASCTQLQPDSTRSLAQGGHGYADRHPCKRGNANHIGALVGNHVKKSRS